MQQIEHKIFVILINLDIAKKRLFEIDQRLKRLNIKYVRLNAIDGKNYIYSKDEFNEKLYKICNGKRISSGEIGCYLSHYNAIKLFLDSDKKFALILEDDAIFNLDFLEVIINLVNIENFWDFVKFNTARDYGFGNIAVKKLFKEYKLYASFFPKAFSAAYLINRKAAKSLYDRLLHMYVPFDHEMIKFWKYDIRQYSIFPSPVRVEYKDSFIGTYGERSRKFPFYKRISVLFYRIFIQLKRSIYFYKLLNPWNKY